MAGSQTSFHQLLNILIPKPAHVELSSNRRQSTAVRLPQDPSRPGPEYEFLAIPETSKPAYTAEPARLAGKTISPIEI